MLEAKGLYSYYGKSPILQDVAFSVEQGGFLGIVGRNGVGKTTLLRTIMGLTDRATGQLSFDGESLLAMRTPRRAGAGIAYIPQGREVIPRFTVRENLLMGMFPRKDRSRTIPEHIFELFPILAEFIDRRGGDLSGGQQQQLAIGRALAMDPKILLLDEPTEGIQPNIVQQLEDVMRRLNKEMGLTIVLVEQNTRFVRQTADNFVLLDKGRVALRGRGEELTSDVVDQYLAL
ncbi:urea ABC transporter ATP-binding subunit UrtE [Aquisalimonas asiatica]|uniref:Amino acid/amide ABC transporter ATP-binding protein 2, HAAT family n=1 Tax=Aquisalimonas asiatica TaxID=406100 RepID=A0A1H8V0K1_9GAMM|nr:urea ABC transporter ATP-binding subunit UrtE [Aquisalimonas asiatica]SEP08734.1 amino acid/amide ABC transporter ATP-binding protein 2, HAAT family [Aquisalimonas asiatica]